MIKASIIIPVYNSEKYLDRCLASIQSQTEENFEVIIINDGSKDASKSIIESYLNDNRFKLINQENHGIGYSRNRGLKISQGKYIAFIDSDDYLEKDYLASMLEKIERDNLDIVVCDYFEENEETGNIKEIIIPSFENTTVQEKPLLLLTVNKAPWNKLYRRDLIKNIKFPEKLKYEDTRFVCEAFKNAHIGKVDRCLNHYIIHSKSETTTMDSKVFDILKIVEEVRNIYRSENTLIDAINKMSLQILTIYTVRQKYQTDKRIRNEFIDTVFSYLEKNIPDYKNNTYFKERGLKGLVEKNKFLTKLYCNFKNTFK